MTPIITAAFRAVYSARLSITTYLLGRSTMQAGTMQAKKIGETA